jgi:hypothetical protein
MDDGLTVPAVLRKTWCERSCSSSSASRMLMRSDGVRACRARSSLRRSTAGTRTVTDLRASAIRVYFFARLATAAASSGFSMANHSALYRPGSALAFAASASSFFTVSGFM